MRIIILGPSQDIRQTMSNKQSIVKQLAKIAFWDWTPDNRLTVMLTTDEKIFNIRLTSFEQMDDEDDYVTTTIYVDDLTDNESYFKDVTIYGLNHTAIDELASAAMDLIADVIKNDSDMMYAQIKGNRQYDKYWADLSNNTTWFVC